MGSSNSRQQRYPGERSRRRVSSPAHVPAPIREQSQHSRNRADNRADNQLDNRADNQLDNRADNRADNQLDNRSDRSPLSHSASRARSNDNSALSVSDEQISADTDDESVTTVAAIKVIDTSQSTEFADPGLCKICLDNEYDMVAIPCGHYGVCQDCCNGLWKEDRSLICPFCYKEDVEFYRVYKQ
jgi:Zinc finger, C3HC4 type (RING finger)